jgi:signal peptidase II
VDFIDLDFFNIEALGYHMSRWPVFNVADASVSVGVVLLLIFHRKFTEAGQPDLSLAAPVSSTPSSDGLKDGPANVESDSSSQIPS